MNKFLVPILAVVAVGALIHGCVPAQKTSDQIETETQEQELSNLTASIGMPAIKNGFMKKEYKKILELCDQANLVTYAYMFVPQQGKYFYIGQSIGYGIPAATQYTAPQKVGRYTFSGGAGYTLEVVPQADPTGLYSPASTDATWVLLLNPQTKEIVPAYYEDKVDIQPFKRPDSEVINP